MFTTAKTMAFLVTSDPPRARRFFEKTLGLTFLRDEPFALVFDSSGTMLRISKADAGLETGRHPRAEHAPVRRLDRACRL